MYVVRVCILCVYCCMYDIVHTCRSFVRCFLHERVRSIVYFVLGDSYYCRVLCVRRPNKKWENGIAPANTERKRRSAPPS